MSQLPELGFFALYLGALLAVYSVGAGLAAAWAGHRALYLSAKVAMTLTAALSLASCLALWACFFSRDYSVAYVFRNSSNDLPTIYTWTAFWSSLEGSHLLWTTMISLCGTWALWTHARANEHLMPYVTAACGGVAAWMLFLAVTHSDPFARMIPPHSNGLGMNALLQNPYMAIHPPMLFAGYTATLIPFGYTLGALAYGEITEGWLRTVRRWALAAWTLLTVAIALGGRWAYVELGWAGYWAWDPVENASLMPWILLTALLHSLLVQEKIGQLKHLSLLLAIFAFFMSFLGTFITRSGIISSVHSFAESPIGPSYLIFLCGFLIVALGLYAWRGANILPGKLDKVWGVSRESALLITQFLLITFALIVLIGTFFPIVSEAIGGQRISIQAPYFNSFAPFIGAGVMVAVAIGNLLRFQTDRIPNGRHVLISAAVFSLPATIGFVYWGGILDTPKALALGAQVVGSLLAFAAMGILGGELFFRLRDLRFRPGPLLRMNKAYLGAWIAHVGALVGILGFLGNYRGLAHEVTLSTGESTTFFGYEITFDQVRKVQRANALHYDANLQVSRDGKFVTTLHPARSQYPTKPELMHEVGVHETLAHDLYAVLAEFDRDTLKRATLQLHINPTVRFVWLAILLMALGGILSLADRLRGLRSMDTLGAGT